jgi:hypothetical protein
MNPTWLKVRDRYGEIQWLVVRNSEEFHDASEWAWEEHRLRRASMISELVRLVGRTTSKK